MSTRSSIIDRAVRIVEENGGELEVAVLRTLLLRRHGNHLTAPDVEMLRTDKRVSVYEREAAPHSTFIWLRRPVESRDLVSYVDATWHNRDGYVASVRTVHRKTGEFLAGSREAEHIPDVRELRVAVENRALVSACRLALQAF